MKYLIPALLLMMACSFAYTITAVTVSDEVNMNENGGFSVTVTNDTTTENISGLTLYTTILDAAGVPVKQVCAYEDSENCYLWKTDASGKANGLFHVDNVLVIGQSYNLSITAGDAVDASGNFTVKTMRDLSYTADYVVWFKNNFMFIALVLGAIFFFLVVAAFLLRAV